MPPEIYEKNCKIKIIEYGENAADDFEMFNDLKNLLSSYIKKLIN